MNVSSLPKNRWRAFGGHLILSLLILLVLAAFIAFSLFPDALFALAGGVEGLKIIAGVDIVLGPLITLVIYNVTKPRHDLLRDLLIIGLIQIAALTAGMYIVYKSRPAAVVYTFDTVHAVRLADFAEAKASPPDNLPWFSPGYFYLDLPEDDNQAFEVMATKEFSDRPARVSTEEFVSMSTARDDLLNMLRASSQERNNPECVIRDIETAFNATKICFDANHRKIKSRTSE